jgi:hypothetical protein
VARSRRDDLVWWPSAEEALANLTVSELKKLAVLVSATAPNRKPRLVALLVDQLEGERLPALWGRLGELERAAIGEVVHGSERRFNAEQFRAKYGRDPDWGVRDNWGCRVKASPLSLFIYQGVIPDDLLARLEPFVARPAEASIDSVKELPAAIERLVEHCDHGKHESGTETVLLVVGERERAAHEELASVLRLIDAGKVAVSDKTRRATSAAVRVLTSIARHR